MAVSLFVPPVRAGLWVSYCYRIEPHGIFCGFKTAQFISCLVLDAHGMFVLKIKLGLALALSFQLSCIVCDS